MSLHTGIKGVAFEAKNSIREIRNIYIVYYFNPLFRELFARNL